MRHEEHHSDHGIRRCTYRFASNSWDLARTSMTALWDLDGDLLLELTELTELTMTSCEAQSELLETE